MLSRVAERTYWLARYLERAENAARLIDVYSALLLDLPESTRLNWDLVLEIMGCMGGNTAIGPDRSERDKLEFLLFDEANPSALINTLNQARENARTTRDIVPTEGWRAVNELCLYARDALPTAIRARHRRLVMAELVQRVQRITGLLSGAMSHGSAYQFLRVGRNLERADMTSRTIDVAVALMMTDREELQRYDNTLWMAVLRCVSGYQMYRQYVRRRVRGPDVINFLFKDQDFPRAVQHCIGEVAAALESLPRSAAVVARVARSREYLAGLEPGALDNGRLHQLVDELQLEFAGLNDAVAQIWFHPGQPS